MVGPCHAPPHTHTHTHNTNVDVCKDALSRTLFIELSRIKSESERGGVGATPVVAVMMMMGGSCRCIVGLCILNERHTLQNCSNGVDTTSGVKENFMAVGQAWFVCFTPYIMVLI